MSVTGGCQCGAVRFRAEGLGRSSVCHCRMCQKAFGGFFGPLVTAQGLVWTRGEPARFRSSNLAQRGFCAVCGTPLTYEYDGAVDIAIGALDEPQRAAPTVQLNLHDKLSFADRLGELPLRPEAEREQSDAKLAEVRSHQHPDHDTATWPLRNGEQP